MDKKLALEILKERASKTYFSEMKKDDVLTELIEQFSLFATGFTYIHDMDYLIKAVMFYMIHSNDMIRVKEKVQHVCEQVIENDYNIKRYEDILYTISGTLDEIHEIINKDSIKETGKGV